MNKKGIEIAVNFFVMLIIIIVIFGGAIYLTTKFFKTTEEIKATLDADTEAQIEALMDDGSLVAVPIISRKVRLKEGAGFGVGILNILGEEKKFEIAVNFDTAFDKDEAVIANAARDYINVNWVGYFPGPHTIANNDRIKSPIKIVPQTLMAEKTPTVAGTYVFNICVYAEGASRSGNCGDPPLNQSYSGKVYQAYVKVVKG